MVKIFLILGIVIITSSVVGIVLILIDKNQSRKRNDIKLSDEVGVLFDNNSLKVENIGGEKEFIANNRDESVVELEII